MVEKRRRKKARVQAESSSEGSDSENDISINGSANELSELSDAGEITDPTSPETKQGLPQIADTPRHLLHKAPKNVNQDFNQVFLGMVTEQFGEELAALRQSNDFGGASISQLVAGLKEGVDIFSEDQRRMLQQRRTI